jgi:hypothetical protein
MRITALPRLASRVWLALVPAATLILPLPPSAAAAESQPAEAPSTRPTTSPASAATTTAAPDPVFSLHPVDGRLILVANVEGRVSCGAGRYWCSDGEQAQFDDYRPHCYFSGRVCVRSDKGQLELAGWREVYHDWQVIRFSLTQTPDATRAEYTVRTPVGQPDVTVAVTEPDVDLLLLRHPELGSMVGEVFKGLGGDSWFDFDPAVRAQVDPDDWQEPNGMEDVVYSLLPGLSSADWRERDRTEKALGALGRDGALYMMLRLDRSALSAQQNLAIDRVVRHFPRLTPRDRELCRREPARLDAPAHEVRLAGVSPAASTATEQVELTGGDGTPDR